MIRFVTGVPGAGKSLYTVQQVLRELRFGNRPIITNLPVRIGPWARAGVAQLGMLEYLTKLDGKDHDVSKRVHVLPEDEVSEFWRFRCGADGELRKLKVEWEGGQDKGQVLGVEGMAETVACVYVIDEAWQYFGSRQWQATSRGVQWYMAQHRKLGDDVFVTTQHFGQVDKQLRLLVGEYHECINRFHRKLMFWRQPGVIQVNISNDPPERQGRNTAESKLVRLDRAGVCSCYDTAAGAGVKGATADIGRRAAGLPLWTLFAAVFVVAALIYFIPDWVARGAAGGQGARPSKGSPVEVAVPASAAIVPVPSPVMVSKLPILVGETARIPVNVVEPFVEVTGKCWVQGVGWQVTLSDGRVVGVEDGLQAIGRGWVAIAGRPYPWRGSAGALALQAERGPSSAPARVLPSVVPRVVTPSPAISPF